MKYRTMQPQEVKEGEIIRRSFSSGVVKEINEEKRTIDFVISTEAVDRVGDIIRLNGWDLKAYRKNPVVLFGHNSRIPPIGRAPKVWKEDGALKATAQFMPEEISPFAFSIFRMYQERFLNAVSVGFMPLKWELIADDEDKFTGIDFKKQELYEFSAVPIPANPEALIDARSKGIDTKPFKDWAEDMLDNWVEASGPASTLYGVDRKDVELIRRKAAGTGLIYNVPLDVQEELKKRNFSVQEKQASEEQKGAEMDIKTGFITVEADQVEDLQTQAKDAGFSLMLTAEKDDKHTFLALPVEEKADQNDCKPLQFSIETVDKNKFLRMDRTPDRIAIESKCFDDFDKDTFSLEERDEGIFVTWKASDRIAIYKLTGMTEDGIASADLQDVTRGHNQPISYEEEEVEDKGVEETEAEADVEAESEETTDKDVNEDEGAETAREENKNNKPDRTRQPSGAEGEEEVRTLEDAVSYLEFALPDLEEALDKANELGQSPKKSVLRKMHFLAEYMKELAERIRPTPKNKEQGGGNGVSEDEDYISVSDIDKIIVDRLQPKLSGIIQTEVNKARGKLPDAADH